MDRGQVKDAIRSYLPSSRLIYRTLAIVFLLMFILSCWPVALAKIPFIPSVHHDLQGSWRNGITDIRFDKSSLSVQSMNNCYSNSHHNISITDEFIIFNESGEQQSYRTLPSLGEWIDRFTPVFLAVDSPGPIPPGIYHYSTLFFTINC
jgi:hypothetical protein